MTSRHEDRDGTSTALGWGRERSRALFIHWLRIHARTLVHSHDHDDRVTSVLATRSHRCALSEPHFQCWDLRKSEGNLYICEMQEVVLTQLPPAPLKLVCGPMTHSCFYEITVPMT